MTRLACAFVLMSAAVAGAASVTLPPGIEMQQGSDSPGVVTFYHETHVDAAKPRCTTCHPRPFRMLKATTPTRITHERFDRGEACASCHDGKKAFAIDEDCSNCHKS